MTFYGYIRVSTKKQGESGLGLESQYNTIRYLYPDAEIFLEVKSGKNTTERPVLTALIDRCVKEKATLVVAKVDRLVRNTKDGLELYEQLQGRIHFIDLPAEPSELMLTMYFAFATHERKMISIRTKGGLASKRKRGEKMGFSCHKTGNFVLNRDKAGEAIKLESISNEDNVKAHAYAISLKKQNKSLAEICEDLNVSKYRNSGGRKWIPSTLCRLFKRYASSDQLFSPADVNGNLVAITM